MRMSVRHHISANHFPKRLSDTTHRLTVDHKPHGLWYGVDLDWLRWCHSEMPEWISVDHAFEVEVDLDKILVISTENELQLFNQEYSSKLYKVLHVIDWNKVAAKGYMGIEIAPYQWNYRYDMSWYYSWDCASGCIWNPKAVLGLREVDAAPLLSEVMEGALND